MTRKARRGARLAGAAAFCALAAAPVAHGALAGAPAATSQTRPNLRSVTLDGGATPASDRAHFCFDRPLLSGSVVPTGFAVGGYDATQRTASVDAVLDADDQRCAIAVFPDDADLAAATIGLVDDGAVRAQDSGKLADGDAAALTGSTQEADPGRTDAPDLLRATPDPSFNELVLRFDRRVGDPGDPAAYSYYDPAGNRQAGISAAVDLDDRHVVRVAFAATGATSVRDAVRAAVRPGTVGTAGAPGKTGPGRAVAVDGQDGETARPELVSASRSAPDAIDFAFDAPVAVADASRFALYRDEGSRYPGAAAAVLTSRPSVVRVWFGSAVGRFSAALVLATVEDDSTTAVRAVSGALPNTAGSVPIGALDGAAGFTSAPDATALAFDSDDGTATITFDQPVDDTAPLSAADFRLLDRFGNETAGASSAVVNVSGSQVKVAYGAGRVAAGAAVQLRAAAVHATSGDPSVAQIIALPAPAPAAPVPGAGAGDPTAAAASGSAEGDTTLTVSEGDAAAAPRPAARRSRRAARRAPAARVVLARLRAGRHGRLTLVLRVRARARTVRARVAVANRHGRTIGVLVRRVRTNRTVRIGGLPRPPGGKVRISIAR